MKRTSALLGGLLVLVAFCIPINTYAWSKDSVGTQFPLLTETKTYLETEYPDVYNFNDPSSSYVYYTENSSQTKARLLYTKSGEKFRFYKAEGGYQFSTPPAYKSIDILNPTATEDYETEMYQDGIGTNIMTEAYSIDNAQNVIYSFDYDDTFWSGEYTIEEAPPEEPTDAMTQMQFEASVAKMIGITASIFLAGYSIYLLRYRIMS